MYWALRIRLGALNSTVIIGVGAQSTFGERTKTFLPDNICMKKIYKMLEFYMMFANALILHDICTEKK